MNILIVFCHPIRESFNGALLNSAVEQLESSGHSVKVADLYREQFQPAMIAEDFAQFNREPMPQDVQKEQARVEWSDGIIFIFPVWWWSIPAMLKGWIDRVISYGWAWENPLDPDSGHLESRKILVMTTAGASKEHFAKRWATTIFAGHINQKRTIASDQCGFYKTRFTAGHRIR